MLIPDKSDIQYKERYLEKDGFKATLESRC